MVDAGRRGWCGRSDSNLHFGDKAPDFRIFASLAEIGAAWKKTSNEGCDHLSVKLHDPSLPAPILANLFEMEGGEFELIWSRPNGNRSR